MNRSRVFRLIAVFICVVLALNACRTASTERRDAGASSPTEVSVESGTSFPVDLLTLTFAGDIMAHAVNYSMVGYDRIYDDVRQILQSDDLSFANLETPICDELPLSSYPRFNAHADYWQAAIRGGFDVFSLANNHANDQNARGVRSTITAFEGLSETAPGENPRVWASGLRKNETDSWQPTVVKKGSWTVVFVAATEILNSRDAASKLVHYVAPTENERSAFLEEIARMRRENPCDLFVLSLHSFEPEYVRTVSDGKKAWFTRLADAGVDIVWAHHPHVMQTWEPVAASGKSALMLYSMGNFVSGQRFAQNFADPASAREYTGDAALIRVVVSRTRTGNDGASRIEFSSVAPIPVTNWNDPQGGVVVRRFTKEFVENLPEQLRAYYGKRYALMAAYVPLLPTPPGTDILK